MWNREEYVIKAHETKQYPDWLAMHFAKHFVDREMNKAGKPTDGPEIFDLRRKCLTESTTEASSELELQVKTLNEKPHVIPTSTMPSAETITASTPEVKAVETVKTPWCDSCDSKGVRHKKECPKNPKKEVFEGLAE